MTTIEDYKEVPTPVDPLTVIVRKNSGRIDLCWADLCAGNDGLQTEAIVTALFLPVLQMFDDICLLRLMQRKIGGLYLFETNVDHFIIALIDV